MNMVCTVKRLRNIIERTTYKCSLKAGWDFTHSVSTKHTVLAKSIDNL